jgi:hypothetical protein
VRTAVLLAAMAGGAGFWAGAQVARRGARADLAVYDARLSALQRTVAALDRRGERPPEPVGTAGPPPPPVLALSAPATSDEALAEAVASRVRRELGLVAPRTVRERRASFAELYTTDESGALNYGTAGHLGGGYFITVKHAVVATAGARRITNVRLRFGDRVTDAEVVDAGDAANQVEPGDWAILRVHGAVPLPALRPNLHYEFPFADPIVRLGNDYSKGVIASAGFVGEHSGGLVTCLTDGHPGVSGGGVLNQDGDLVGIPVGRMQGDYRFSFLLPLRSEMFRKVPALNETLLADARLGQ